MALRSTERIAERYEALQSYLKSSMKEISSKISSSAMQRISRLPIEQFNDVSNDLYDELKRRMNNPEIPFLPIREDLLPKRNQARQKMATLNEQRFKELAYELMIEIENRFPEVIRKPLPDPRIRSESIREPRSSRTRRSSPTRPSRSGRSRERELRNVNPIAVEDVDAKIKQISSDYEFTILGLEKKLKMLEERLKESQNLERQIERLEKENETLNAKNSQLKSDYNRLEKEAQSMSELTNENEELKRELGAEQKMNKQLQRKLQEADEENQRQASELKTAKNEADSIMKDYERVRDLLKTANEEKESLMRSQKSPETSSISSPKRDIEPKKDSSPVRNSINYDEEDNDDDDPNFAQYRKVAKKLMNAISNNDNSAVLPSMRELLLECKQISQLCERFEDDPSVAEEDRQIISEIKNSLSERLNILMKITKEHVSSGSSRARSTIEKELKNLSFSISDLSETIKVINSNQRKTDIKSKRETMRTEAPEIEPLSVDDLREYLDDQLNFIIDTRQDLLDSIDSNDSADTIANLINELCKTIDNISIETKDTLDSCKDSELTDKVVYDCDDLVAILGDIRNELFDLSDDILEAPSDKSMFDRLLNTADDLEKHVGDLVSVIAQNNE